MRSQCQQDRFKVLLNLTRRARQGALGSLDYLLLKCSSNIFPPWIYLDVGVLLENTVYPSVSELITQDSGCYPRSQGWK
jgi:hypothetical protein